MGGLTLGLGLGLGQNAALGGGGGAPVNPVQTNIAAWFKYGEGITGDPVSQWDDVSGNARHLKQTTAPNRPSLSGSAVLFDGVDNFLKCDAFTYAPPMTVYLLVKQITWTNNDALIDGNASGTMNVYQGGVTPAILLYSGGSAASNTGLVLNTYSVVCAVYNGASSSLRVNNNAKTTGTVGTGGAGGFMMGADATPSGYANAEFKEAILYTVAHDDANQALVIAYLAAVGGLSI